MTANPTAHASTMELVTMLQQELSELSGSAAAAREEREAARWLYEQLANYKGMLYRRPLLRSIEFLVHPPSKYGQCFQPGWYYRSGPKDAINWIGPHASHDDALAARDKALPRKVATATLAKLAATPEFFT